ncbi:hypothetical protein [Scytonema sp. HK-05]|uniref:hypothetical protein n=1 Tax=Scytonema sp. HK-05 TaxID=1137095 RepID=UPI00130117DD|nr:hypothetical protein [Scytonema sp. HK-05]
MTHVLLVNHGGFIRVQAPPTRSVSVCPAGTLREQDSAQYPSGDRDSQLHQCVNADK